MENKLYCPVCQKLVSYNTTEQEINLNVDEESKDVVFIQLVSRCDICGEELYNDDQQKENQRRFEEAYHKKYN